MSQNTLIEKIKADAAKTVEEIKATGTSEVLNIQRDMETKLAELRNSHEVALEKKKAQAEVVAVSKAKQAGKIAIQSAKREQIDAIFSEVMDELANQPETAYVKFFTKFVSKNVPNDVEIDKVQAPKKREEETVKILKEAGLTGEVKVDGLFQAGLIIKTKDGVYDVTLERLMTENRAELEVMVVNKAGV